MVTGRLGTSAPQRMLLALANKAVMADGSCQKEGGEQRGKKIRRKREIDD